jgi:flavodoxin
MKKKIISLFATLMVICCVCSGFTVSSSTSEETNRTIYTVQDVVNLQNFLLNRSAKENLQDKPYDMNNDGVWNVFDLCMMKHELLIPAQNDNDTVVVYFSRTNNTEKIANYIINITGAEKYEIEAEIPYTDEDIDYTNSSCRANKEQNDKSCRPEIAEPMESIDSYEVIYLGYPIWWGEEPRIIDTFLESYDFSDKTIIPFCTSASSGIATSEKNIRNLVPIGNLLEGKRFSASASESEVEEWINELNIMKKPMEEKLYLTINGTKISATFEDNSSAQALKEKLAEGDIVIDAQDYGSFEKAGDLGFLLPRNDTQITTTPGDLILYQGNQFTIYYDENSWNFTKLGHVDNITQSELKSLLGDGDVQIILSLK